MIEQAIAGSPLNAAMYENGSYRCIVWQRESIHAQFVARVYHFSVRSGNKWFQQAEGAGGTIQEASARMESRHSLNVPFDQNWQSVPDTPEFREIQP